jgi:hypothetical protein
MAEPVKSRVSVLAIALAVLPAMAGAIPIFGTGSLGSFTGSLEYTSGGDTSGAVDVELSNTSPVANGGFITAFVFNIPAGASLSSVILTPSDADFGVIGGPSFSDSVNGAPFGQFDIGASTFMSFEGGGPPSLGIGVGGMATFSFSLTGTGLGSLTAGDFLATLSVPPGDGEGHEAFVVRFRGFNDGGSDKVPGQVVPEPATAGLVGLGLTGLWARRFRASRSRA